MKIMTITLPAHWASYLINGDASGLDDGEQAIVDRAIERECGQEWTIVSCDDGGVLWWARGTGRKATTRRQQARGKGERECGQEWTIVSCDDEARFTWSYALYNPEADCAGGSVLDYQAIREKP